MNTSWVLWKCFSIRQLNYLKHILAGRKSACLGNMGFPLCQSLCKASLTSAH